MTKLLVLDYYQHAFEQGVLQLRGFWYLEKLRLFAYHLDVAMFLGLHMLGFDNVSFTYIHIEGVHNLSSLNGINYLKALQTLSIKNLKNLACLDEI